MADYKTFTTSQRKFNIGLLHYRVRAHTATPYDENGPKPEPQQHRIDNATVSIHSKAQNPTQEQVSSIEANSSSSFHTTNTCFGGLR